MTISAVTSFWVVSFLLVLVPGADWAYAISAGLRDRSVLPAVSGLLTGYIALTVVVTAGVAALIVRWPLALTGLTIAGALYLLWLGVVTVTRPPTPDASDDVGSPSCLRRALKGVGISGLNPKALLLFLALLPQFATRNGPWPFAVQIALLGLVHICNCGFVYTGVGTAARRILRTRPATAAMVTRLSGAAMIAIGLLLAADRLLALRVLVRQVDDAEAVAVGILEDYEVRVSRVAVPVDLLRPERHQSRGLRLLLGRVGGVQIEMDPWVFLYRCLAELQSDRQPVSVGRHEQVRPAAEPISPKPVPQRRRPEFRRPPDVGNPQRHDPERQCHAAMTTPRRPARQRDRAGRRGR